MVGNQKGFRAKRLKIAEKLSANKKKSAGHPESVDMFLHDLPAYNKLEPGFKQG
jgi:hypothetical protein